MKKCNIGRLSAASSASRPLCPASPRSPRIGTAIAGVGFGTGFQGALRSVIGQIEPQQRAGVLSVLFVVSYLELGIPAIAAGYRLAQRGDIVEIAHDLGAITVILAMLALIGTFRRR